MQPAPGRRALSGLASKLHLQLPLNQRQSQQLLALLTTSFREHLDREHPVAVSEPASTEHSGPALPPKRPRRSSAPSSQSFASTHIESILTNPLFAVPPRRRGSNPLDAREVLRDPLAWFDSEIASGNATVQRAVTCVEMWEKATAIQARPAALQQLHSQGKPGTKIAEWLRTSGEETSKHFVDQERHLLLAKMVPLLLQENETAPIWRWFVRSPEVRMKETGLDMTRVQAFRIQVLKLMISSKLASESTIDGALTTFLQAVKMLESKSHGMTTKVLQPSGSSLIVHILANPTTGVSIDLYGSFLKSIEKWTGLWSKAIESILWLNHPSKPNAAPGLAYIKDPRGALTQVQGTSLTRRRLLVQLCLGVAHQLLAEHKIADSQIAMEFAQNNFPELVLRKTASRNHILEQKEREEKQRHSNHILNQLVPG